VPGVAGIWAAVPARQARCRLLFSEVAGAVAFSSSARGFRIAGSYDHAAVTGKVSGGARSSSRRPAPGPGTGSMNGLRAYQWFRAGGLIGPRHIPRKSGPRRSGLVNASIHQEWHGYDRPAGPLRRWRASQPQSSASVQLLGPLPKRSAKPGSLQCNRLWPYVRCGRRQARLEKCRANCAETVPRDGNWCSFSITGILQSRAI
jgi:hypothetical protein